MPEIGEVARIVHYLKKHLVGKTIAAVKTQEDDIVYGKVGTSATAFKKAITGKKVLDARQQGKYFWLVMSSPPHPLMHFGMTGWMKFSSDDTSYYKPTKQEEEPWPPKFWKFVLETAEEPKCEVAFVDARRLARIRLVDAEGDKMRSTTPLKENGPDPVIDRDVVTMEWLTRKMRSKKVPVKALLLDQANISGVGNWVADEILYQAKIHPEQYSNTFSDDQMKQLHDSLIGVCKLAVDTLADSSQFPENWLMRHRWSKGKKDGGKLPDGTKIQFLKVGGRTSAIVPGVQKKTGQVAGDVSADAEGSQDGADGASDEKEDASRTKTARRTKASGKAKTNGTQAEKDSKPSKPAKRGRGKAPAQAEDEVDEPEHEEEDVEEGQGKKRRKTAAAASKSSKKSAKDNAPKEEFAVPKDEDHLGRRRSTRISKA
ncbi:hypothetical protein H2201_001184 [Coniosporium apollinis]|uniref:Formamidopyrimidine-DNA glycosylase catalytic domain-containing protein n=1 Tax=Coniosporium apollinis TaxID=61459 RepID=A0ABQ9P6N8_9PEZI|nr:hypothetical protein H2201_001184 [Coniosporium apollinis]